MAQAPPCPYCGSTAYQLRDQHWLICTACGHEFDVHRDVCPACGHLNQTAATSCTQCQSPLRKDNVDRILEARSKDRKGWQTERLTIAEEQRKEEEEASKQRMDAFWAKDKARLEAAAKARAETQERERRVLLIVAIVSILLIALLIVGALILSAGT